MELGQGVRPPWSSVPPDVVTEVEGWLGGPLTAVLPVVGGFSPTVAARVRTGGRTGFVKIATTTGVNPDVARYARQEIRIAAALPDIPQLAPLRWSFDDGAWVASGFDDLAGAPPRLPWSTSDVDAVLAAIADVHTALTPAPLPVDSVRESMSTIFGGWGSLSGAEPGLDDWSRRNLPRLQELEAAWPDGLSGNTLLHADLRSDNVVLAPGRGPVVVDLPAACMGPAWFDLAALAPSLEAEGGPRCADLLSRCAPHAPEIALTFAAVGLAGYFIAQSLRPPPPGLPTVRAFQARQAIPARAWVAERLDLPCQ